MKLKTQLKNSKLKNFDQKTCHPNHRFEIRANMAAFRAKQSNMADEPAEVEGRQDGYLSCLVDVTVWGRVDNPSPSSTSFNF